MDTQEKIMLTQKDLAKALRVSKETIRILTKEGMPCLYASLTIRKRRSCPRYDFEVVKAWLKARSEKKTTQKGGEA